MKRSYRKSRCRKILSRKIGKNMKEYKKGRYSSREQAIAVSYSQVRKSNPSCSRSLRRKGSRKGLRKGSRKGSRKISRKSRGRKSQKKSKSRKGSRTLKISSYMKKKLRDISKKRGISKDKKIKLMSDVFNKIDKL
jgi:hypothetical protein